MGMGTAKVYIETSVFNFVFAYNEPERRRDTLVLFDEIRHGKYKPYTSSYVIRELVQCPEPQRSDMLKLIDEYGVKTLADDVEAEQLAAVYVAAGVIPQRYLTDAIHIAVATVNDMDFIVSFNFKHIVKRKTVTMTEAINLHNGYRRIGIFSPTEVIDYDDSE